MEAHKEEKSLNIALDWYQKPIISPVYAVFHMILKRKWLNNDFISSDCDKGYVDAKWNYLSIFQIKIR